MLSKSLLAAVISIISTLEVCAQPGYEYINLAPGLLKHRKETLKAPGSNTRLVKTDGINYDSITYETVYTYPNGNCWNDRTRMCEPIVVTEYHGKWNFEKMWPARRTMKIFNGAGELIEESIEEPAATPSKWKTQRRITMEYTTYSKTTTVHFPENPKLKDQLRSEYKYDDLGRVLEHTIAGYSRDSGRFVNYLKYTYSYAPEGILSEIKYEWSNNNWRPEYEKHSKYNEGRLVQIEEKLDRDMEGMPFPRRHIITELHYDEQNRNTDDRYLWWNFDTNEWELAATVAYHYDSNNDIDSVFTELLQEGCTGSYVSVCTFDRQPLKVSCRYKEYAKADFTGNSWLLTNWGEWTRFYEAFEQHVDDVSQGEVVHIYPNPARNTINIAINPQKPIDAVIQVYGTDGRVVYKWDLPNISVPYKEQKDLSALPSGIYYFKVQAGDRHTVSKVQVIH